MNRKIRHISMKVKKQMIRKTRRNLMTVLKQMDNKNPNSCVRSFFKLNSLRLSEVLVQANPFNNIRLNLILFIILSKLYLLKLRSRISLLTITRFYSQKSKKKIIFNFRTVHKIIKHRQQGRGHHDKFCLHGIANCFKMTSIARQVSKLQTHQANLILNSKR